MSDVEIDYEYLTQRALKKVLRDVLEMTAELGVTPGEHHFYIEFMTDFAGVAIPDVLREAYPERMTIVLQHQFENLIIREDEFAATLWFKGVESHLVIPFEAVTSFADPSVGFGLRFSPEPRDAAAPKSAETAPAATKPEPAPPKKSESGEVVSLDQFRKK